MPLCLAEAGSSASHLRPPHATSLRFASPHSLCRPQAASPACIRSMSDFPAVRSHPHERGCCCRYRCRRADPLAAPQLDDFNDFSAGPTSSSAAGQQGDFLARERELLGDEFGPTPTGLPSASDFQDPSSASRSHFPELDDAAAPSNGAARPASNDFVSSFQRDPAPSAKPNSASVAIDDDDDDDDLMGGGARAAPAAEREDDSAVQQFQSQYPDLQLYPPQDDSSNNAYASSQSHQVRSPFAWRRPGPGPASPNRQN